jgi:acetyl-CoA acyltransferase 1
MTFGYRPVSQLDSWSEAVLLNQKAQDSLILMDTTENFTSDFSISRQQQDEFSTKSFQKVAAAQKAGKFLFQEVPYMVQQLFFSPVTLLLNASASLLFPHLFSHP